MKWRNRREGNSGNRSGAHLGNQRPSITASGSPVARRNSSITAMCVGKPREHFPDRR